MIVAMASNIETGTCLQYGQLGEMGSAIVIVAVDSHTIHHPMTITQGQMMIVGNQADVATVHPPAAIRVVTLLVDVVILVILVILVIVEDSNSVSVVLGAQSVRL